MEFKEYKEAEKTLNKQLDSESNSPDLLKYVSVWLNDREPEKFKELVSRFHYLEPAIYADQEMAQYEDPPF
ncbi:MAG: hypothetical protein CMF71_09460 [Magnetovibrio sp.]|nr:hypothetical protein [Magnetovibrio sp.]|tara:strand:- start:437 stop:649 length:213 start_codon:yes stop_codon:yes gene_type:complete